MNALCYKIVFSKRLGALVAVGEHTSGQGKAAGTGVRTAVYPSSAVGATAGEFVGSLKAVFASVALTCFTATTIAAGPAANTLPTGYSVNSGHVAVSTSGADMTIKQTTDKASVNWQSFSIGSAASVNIQQNSASSVLLNRVVGNDPSQIFGKLTANGQVILINPNGIVFGKGGSVTASAFTASTFGMTEDDFNKGKRKFSRNGSTASVTVEEGASINTTTPGGYIALIASTVNNQGSISAKQGSVVLAAAETVTLPSALTDNVGIPLSSKVRLELAPSTIKASVENGGTITTDGGQVLMQAAAVADAVASITHTGTIDTTGEQGGAVTLQADHGIIKATGTIKASSKNAKNKGGDIIIGRDEVTGVLAASADVSSANLESQGGFVETSGQYLKTDGIKVKAKEWLLDPSDITISSSADSLIAGAPGSITPNGGVGTTSNVKVDTIQNAINGGTNVTIQTTNGGNGTGAGNITIANALAFKNTGATDATLSLIADNGIIQNTGATITTDLVNSTKLVNISMEAKGNYQGNTAANVNSKGITLNSTIITNGDVTLVGTNQNTGGGRSNSGVVFNGGSGITAKVIQVTGIQKKSGTTDANGIAFNGSTTFNSTGTSTFDGTSSSIGNASAGIYVEDGATLNLNSGAGSMHFKGNNTNNGYRGIRLGYVSPATTTINTYGNVIFGTDTSAKQTFLRAKLNVNSGSVTMQGSEVQLYDGAVLTAKNGTTVNLTGQTINLGQAGSAVIKKDTGGFSLNMTGDKVMIQNMASVDAGTGTVAVKTLTPGREIQLGADDVATKMGLTNAELGLIKAGQVVIGDTSTGGTITVAGATSTGATTGNVTLITAGKIDVNSALTVNGNQLILNAKGNVNVNANIVKNGTGHVVLAAGSNEAASTDTGGQVTASAGKTVSNDNGNIYIYSGSAGNSAGLKGLNNAFIGGFQVSGDVNQNTDTNVAFPSSSPYGITGSTAKAQVMFREKLAVDLGTLRGTSFIQNYGDDATKNTTAAQTTLLGLAKSELITANSLNGSFINVTSGTGISAAVIKVDKGLVVKSMEGELATPSWSGSDYLNAKSDGYVYGKLESSKYTVTPIDAGKVKVIVNKANLTEVTAAKTYDGFNTVTSGQMISIKGVRGEIFSVTGGTAAISGKDVSGNKTIDDLSGLTLTSLTGGASSNYNLSSGLPSHGTNNNVAIGQATLTEVSGAKTYDGTTNLANGTLTIKGVHGEEFTTTLASVNIQSKNVADNATNKVANIASLTLTGKNDASIELAGNYNLAVDPSRNKVEISAKDVTYSGISVNSKEYDGNRTAGLNGAAALATVAAGGVSTDKKVISTDTVGLNGTLIGTFDNKNVLGTDGLGSNLVRLTGLSLEGVHASNYNLVEPDPVIANNKITPRALTAIYAANNKTFDGTNNAVVTGILKDKVSGDVVNLKHSSATFDSSDIGNAKVVTVFDLKLEGADAGNYKLNPTLNAGNKATTTANITARLPTPPTPVVPTNNAGARVKVPVGSANPFALASAEDLADDTCSANSVENCYCEESAVSQGVDICYEPKTAAKGSVR